MSSSQDNSVDDGGNTLDVRGYVCPIPTLKARKTLLSLKSGDVLNVFTSDPNSFDDFEQFCQENGHILQKKEQIRDFFSLLIKKA